LRKVDGEKTNKIRSLQHEIHVMLALLPLVLKV
jgi:hypothetical protein